MTSGYGSPSEYGGDFFQPRPHLGALLLVKVYSIDNVVTSLGEKEAARCDIDILDGPGAGNRFPDALLFNAALVRVSRARLNAAGVGAMVLGRLALGEGKSGQNAPFVLLDASEQDMKIADDFIDGQSKPTQPRYEPRSQPSSSPSSAGSFRPPPNYPSQQRQPERPSFPDQPPF